MPSGICDRRFDESEWRIKAGYSIENQSDILVESDIDTRSPYCLTDWQIKLCDFRDFVGWKGTKSEVNLQNGRGERPIRPESRFESRLGGSMGPIVREKSGRLGALGPVCRRPARKGMRFFDLGKKLL
jgi:hypothetical protein